MDDEKNLNSRVLGDEELADASGGVIVELPNGTHFEYTPSSHGTGPTMGFRCPQCGASTTIPGRPCARCASQGPRFAGFSRG